MADQGLSWDTSPVLRDGFLYPTPMKQRYHYRLYPRPHQKVALAKAFGCAPVVHNDAWAKGRELHEQGQKAGSSELMKLCITQARQTPERAWLSGPGHLVLQQSIRDLDQAFRNWWGGLKGKRRGLKANPPRFERRHGVQSIRFISHVFPTGERALTLSKAGPVPIQWSRVLPSKPSGVTVITDASGRCFASFLVEVEPAPLPENGRAIAIHLGLASSATTSDGVRFAPPRFLRSALRRLRRLQPNLKHKPGGSSRPAAVRRKAAKLHAQVGDRRPDPLRQPSTPIIRENQAVVLEDPNVAGMPRNKKLACSIPDTGWRQLRTLLESKAEPYGRNLIVVNRWLPTSRMCPACGWYEGRKGLSVRQWRCPGCGSIQGRHINAAKTILATGVAARQNGRGAMDKTAPAVAAGCGASTHLMAEAFPCPA